MLPITVLVVAITTLHRNNCIDLLQTLLYQRNKIIACRVANCLIHNLATIKNILQHLKLYLLLGNGREGLEYCTRDSNSYGIA